MAQAILMLTGGISLAIGATVSLGAVIAATTMAGPLGVAGGAAAVALAGLGIGAATGLHRGAASPAGDRRDAGRLLHHRRCGAADPAAARRRRSRMAVRPPCRQHADGLRASGGRSSFCGSSISRRRSGSSLYAAGENPVGAYRSGVPVDAARIAAYAISGLLSTGAGLFVAAQTGSGDPVIGTAFTLNSIAAAVLGGVGFLGGQGTMRGALAGSLLLSLMISVMFFLGFTPVAQYVAQGLIIIGAVALPAVPQAAAMTAMAGQHWRQAGHGDPRAAGRS